MTADASRTESSPASTKHLRGVRVVDVGIFIAGPCAATSLVEFGAEVAKIEKPDGGDSMRSFGTATTRPTATPTRLSESCNRQSVTCDLLRPEGGARFP